MTEEQAKAVEIVVKMHTAKAETELRHNVDLDFQRLVEIGLQDRSWFVHVSIKEPGMWLRTADIIDIGSLIHFLRWD